jgi:DNA replication and repair protein RecF
MSINLLQVSQFRNIQQAELAPVTGLNLITGKNAAGKTSLLESLFYLSYGRSFRSSQARDLIHYGEDYFRLVCKLDQRHTIGIQKSLQQQQIRIDQQSVQRVTELAALLPVIALHPDSHYLISAGPEHRRQFMDWGVFHVEHSFMQVWRDFRKALSQRNAALRQQAPDKLCRLWTQPLVENARKIEHYRLNYLAALEPVLQKNTELLFPNNVLSLDYRRGWPEAEDYEQHLNASLPRDRDKGFTQAGPHRADVKIRLDNKSVQSSVSRGQQKKLVALLKLSQLELFMQTSEKTCVLLYDDLAAELDVANREIVMGLLATMKVQLFISAIDANQLDLSPFREVKLFHVEHGCVSDPGD